jgi:hypothetical protein
MFPRWPIILAACASIAGALPGAAQAATAIRLQTAGDLPFTADELEQAVGARIAMSADSGAALVTVGPAGDDGIQLRMGDRQTVVAVGAHAGLEAARVVALQIAELAADASDEADEADEPEAPRAPPEVIAQTGAASIAAPASPVQAVSASTRLSVAVGSLKGYESAAPFTFTGEADVAIPRNGFDLIGGVGVWDQPTTNAGGPDEVSLLAGVVRAGVGWRRGPAQFVAGPFVAPYRLEGPVLHHTGLLVGGGAMVRIGYRFPVASNIELFGSLRVDAFVNQVRIMNPTEDPTFVTPRLSAALGLGVAWDLGI